MLICWVTSITLGVQVLKANILQISPELEEAARIVGAPQGRTFRDIVIPLALPAIVVVVVMVFRHARPRERLRHADCAHERRRGCNRTCRNPGVAYPPSLNFPAGKGSW
jgi:hypothetical protein